MRRPSFKSRHYFFVGLGCGVLVLVVGFQLTWGSKKVITFPNPTQDGRIEEDILIMFFIFSKFVGFIGVAVFPVLLSFHGFIMLP